MMDLLKKVGFWFWKRGNYSSDFPTKVKFSKSLIDKNLVLNFCWKLQHHKNFWTIFTKNWEKQSSHKDCPWSSPAIVTDRHSWFSPIVTFDRHRSSFSIVTKIRRSSLWFSPIVTQDFHRFSLKISISYWRATSKPVKLTRKVFF